MVADELSSPRIVEGSVTKIIDSSTHTCAKQLTNLTLNLILTLILTLTLLLLPNREQQ